MYVNDGRNKIGAGTDFEMMQGQQMKDFSRQMMNMPEAVKLYLRETLNESRREQRKSQYVSLLVDSNSNFIAVTENLLNPKAGRPIFNFKNPVLQECKSTEGDNGIFKLTVDITGKAESMYLRKAKCGKPQYLMEKLYECGCVVYTPKRSLISECIQRFWEYCLGNIADTVLIFPTHYGWSVANDGRFCFAKKGEALWHEIEEMA